LRIDIPRAVLGEVVGPRPVAPAADPDALIQGALNRPMASPRLEELAQVGQRVAILVDDNTRETPIPQMLPPVLERLQSAGIQRDQIRIVIAPGTHRPLTRQEAEAKVGAALASEYEIVNVSAWDEDQFVYCGTASNGIPAYVNRVVVEAELRVGLGSIVPHSNTGYGGGAKIVLPGVCSARTVDAFHARDADIQTNYMGVAEMPMRHALETFVGERVGLEFILNTVLNGDGAPVQAVAGHYIRAHRAGVERGQAVFGTPVARRYEVVVCNAFPTDHDLWQSTKALWTGDLLTVDGGTLVLLTACREGVTVHPLIADYVGRDPDALETELHAGWAEDPNACGVAIPIARMKRRIRLALVSPTLEQAIAQRMGVAYYDSVEEAIDGELAHQDGSGRVAVLTHGGYTLPLVQGVAAVMGGQAVGQRGGSA
jgi:nickel-dependent lactate racemase